MYTHTHTNALMLTHFSKSICYNFFKELNTDLDMIKYSNINKINNIKKNGQYDIKRSNHYYQKGKSKKSPYIENHKIKHNDFKCKNLVYLYSVKLILHSTYCLMLNKYVKINIYIFLLLL